MPSRVHPRSLLSFRKTEAILTVLLTNVLCWTCAASGLAAPKILKFGYITAPDSQIGGGEKVFAAEIKARTEGRYIIEDYPNSMLGGEVDMMDDLKLGVLDLAFVTGAPLPRFVPEAGVFNIPFLFRDAGEARAVLDGHIGEDYLKKFDDAGFVALAWGENGLRHFTNSKHAIVTPDDLSGLRVRLPQSDVMTTGFKTLNADVVQISFPQLYGALRDHAVDAEENPIATIQSAKLYEVQNYLTLTGHVYDPAIILMSQDAFDDLSDDDKLAFKTAAKAAAQESRKIASDKEMNGIAKLKAEGMLVEANVDKAAFANRVASALPVFEKQFGHDVIAGIKSAAAEARARVPDGKTGRDAP